MLGIHGRNCSCMCVSLCIRTFTSKNPLSSRANIQCIFYTKPLKLLYHLLKTPVQLIDAIKYHIYVNILHRKDKFCVEQMDDITMNLQFSRHVLLRDDRDLVNLVEHPFCRTFPIHVVIYIFRCTGKSDTGTIDAAKIFGAFYAFKNALFAREQISLSRISHK